MALSILPSTPATNLISLILDLSEEPDLYHFSRLVQSIKAQCLYLSKLPSLQESLNVSPRLDPRSQITSRVGLATTKHGFTFLDFNFQLSLAHSFQAPISWQLKVSDVVDNNEQSQDWVVIQ